MCTPKVWPAVWSKENSNTGEELQVCSIKKRIKHITFTSKRVYSICTVNWNAMNGIIQKKILQNLENTAWNTIPWCNVLDLNFHFKCEKLTMLYFESKKLIMICAEPIEALSYSSLKISIEQTEETSDFIRIIYWAVFIISQLW